MKTKNCKKKMQKCPVKQPEVMLEGFESFDLTEKELKDIFGGLISLSDHKPLWIGLFAIASTIFIGEFFLKNAKSPTLPSGHIKGELPIASQLNDVVKNSTSDQEALNFINKEEMINVPNRRR